jgi:hypothetical protein
MGRETGKTKARHTRQTGNHAQVQGGKAEGRTEIARLFCLDDTIAEQKPCDDHHKAKRNRKHTGNRVLHYQVVKGL